jgi:hypothetical protein
MGVPGGYLLLDGSRLPRPLIVGLVKGMAQDSLNLGRQYAAFSTGG